MMLRRLAGALTVVLVCATARAEQGEIDRARALAVEAAELLDEGRYADALDRAARAEQLYHAVFHVWVMGRSLEGLGRLTEAATRYEQIVAEPLPSSAPKVFLDSQANARQQLGQLLARIPSLLVVVKGAPADRVTALLDGSRIELRQDLAIRADPGAHELELSAPGYLPAKRRIDLPPRGGVNRVEATLEPEAKPPAPKPQPKVPVQREQRGSTLPATVAFGVAGAGLIVGAATGAMTLSRVSDLKSRCPDGHCPASAKDDIDSADRLATISNIGFGVALVGAAAGAALLVIRPGASSPAGPESARQRVRWSGWLGIGTAGVRGSFR